ncbi:MAG: hypothetical protein K9I68_02810 [Bacteroidales bacterium]|nr:hypothetical protein [Bacteroidales bacterium]MCF8336370.1 hypothetical protein [Bacteroidales bacterium]
MRLRNFKYLSFFIALTFFGFTALTSCEEDSSNDPNGNNNGTEKTWEPYKFDPNVSFTYEFYTMENGEEQSSGTIEIMIQDPAVEVNATIDGEFYSFSSDSHDAISENFQEAVNNTPAGIVIYQPYWENAFADQVIEEGASWSYNFEDGSVSFEVTGTDTYAGIEGYVVEYDIQNDSGENAMWELCANLGMSLPLMSHVESSDDSNSETFHLELTDYQE